MMFIWKLAMHRNLKDYQKQHLCEIQLEKGKGLKELGGEKCWKEGTVANLEITDKTTMLRTER